MNINPNDLISLKYIANKTGKFDENDVMKYYENISYNENKIMLNILYEISDFDYDFNDTYVNILITELTHIIKF
jgi:hypothetical protein